MAGELESVTREMFGALDRGDAEAVIRLGAEEMQGVDEISRRWLRGLDAVGGYVRQLMGMVEGVHSWWSKADCLLLLVVGKKPGRIPLVSRAGFHSCRATRSTFQR